METLLSLAFDNIASNDTHKIRKGLRQIEGMLAQICLSNGKAKSTTGHRRNASAINLGEQQESTPKKLGQLSDDPAYREFFRLQEGFQWNGMLQPPRLLWYFDADFISSCYTRSRLPKPHTRHEQ